MTTYTYHVTVGANITDESGGNVYAMLMSENIDPESIKGNVSVYKHNMVRLGDVTGIPFGETNTFAITADLTIYFENLRALEANDGRDIIPGVGNYLYIYAVDEYDNDTLVKHDRNVVLSIESTHLFEYPDYLIATSGFFEFKNISNIVEPNITSEPDIAYFGFRDRDNYANVLYSNISILSGEFAISNVYSFALEQPSDVSGNESDFLELIENMNPVKVYTTTSLLYDRSDHFLHEVDTFFDTVTSTTNSSMQFGKTYTLYNAYKKHGMNSMNGTIVERSNQVITGTFPVITDTMVVVDTIVKDFITNLTLTRTSGNITATTTIDTMGASSLSLYTIGLDYPEYDHANVIENIDSYGPTVVSINGNGNYETNLITVRNRQGSISLNTPGTKIYIYQFVTGARNSLEISQGAPSSNITGFFGAVL